MKKPKLPVVRTGVFTKLTPFQQKLLQSGKDKGKARWGFDSKVLKAVYEVGLVTRVSIGNMAVPNYLRLKAYWTYREIAALKAALTR